MIINCPKCSTLNFVSPNQTYAVDADAYKCFQCGECFWIDPECSSEALDESILAYGKPVVQNKQDTSSLMVRNAKEEDFEKIFYIYEKVNSSNCLDKNLNYSRNELLSYLDKLKVVVDHQVLGFFLLFDMGIWGYLDIFCVDPTQRSRGCGGFMLEFIHSLAEIKCWRLINTLIEPENFKTACYFNDRGYNCYKAMLYHTKLIRDKND